MRICHILGTTSLAEDQTTLKDNTSPTLVTALLEMNGPGNDKSHKYVCLSAQQAKAKRPALDTRRSAAAALLRAESTENDAGEARRSPEIIKNQNF